MVRSYLLSWTRLQLTFLATYSCQPLLGTGNLLLGGILRRVAMLLMLYYLDISPENKVEVFQNTLPPHEWPLSTVQLASLGKILIMYNIRYLIAESGPWWPHGRSFQVTEQLCRLW